MRSAAILAVLVCVAMAAAQGGGRQGRQGQFGRGGGMGELGLLARADVQRDLAVSEDQKKKIEELAAANRPARGERRQRGRGDAGGAGAAGAQGADREEMRRRMDEQRAKMQESLKAILSETQMKRLSEISIQLRGSRAIMDEKVQKELGVTEEQLAKVRALNEKMQEANRALAEKARNSEITREDLQKARQKNDETLSVEIGKILTEDQNAKLKTMGGKPFKADPAAVGRRARPVRLLRRGPRRLPGAGFSRLNPKDLSASAKD